MRSFGLLTRLLKGIAMPRQPGYLVFFVTSRCNCSCSMCFNRRNVESTEKPPEIGLHQISRIAKTIGPLPQLLLSGGEPFIRDDIPELVNLFYRHAGTRQISIPTNGALTDTILRSVKQMLTICPDAYLNINLSIDGIGDDHDRYRGLPGCFNSICKTYTGLAELREQHTGMSINVNTIIRTDNAGSETEIIEYIRDKFNVNYHFVSLVRGDVTVDETEFDMDGIEKKLDEIYSRKGGINQMPLFNQFAPAMSRLLRKTMNDARTSSTRNFHCLAGRKIVVLTADGDLYPCEPLWLEPQVRQSDDMTRWRLAHLPEFGYDVKRALKTEHARKIFKYIDAEKCTCRYGCAMLNSIMYSPRMHGRYIQELLSGR